MDCLKLLKDQHEEVAGLFEEYESASNRETRRRLFETIADDLAAHAAIEEKIFYPAVFVGELKAKLKEAVEEHLGAKRLIADLLKMDLDDENFDAKMKVLSEQIEHHIEEEEGSLFPQVKKNFEAAELEALGNEMKTMFEHLQEEQPRSKVPSETDQAAPLT